MSQYRICIILFIWLSTQSNGHIQLPQINLGPNPLAGLIQGAEQAVRNVGAKLKEVNPMGLLQSVQKILVRPHHPPPQHVPQNPPQPSREHHSGYGHHGHQGGYYPNNGYPTQGYYPNQGYPQQGYPGSGQHFQPGYNQPYPGGYPTQHQGYYPGYNPQGYPGSGYPNQGQNQGGTPGNQNAGHGVFQGNNNPGQSGQGGSVHNLGGPNGQPTGPQGIGTTYPGQNGPHGGHGVFQGENPTYPSRPNQQNVGYPSGSTPRPNQGYRPSAPGTGYPGQGGQSNVPYRPVVEGNIGESSYPGKDFFGGNQPTGYQPSNPPKGSESSDISFGQGGTTNSPQNWGSQTNGGHSGLGSSNYEKNEENTGGYTPGKGTQGIKQKEELIFDPEAEEVADYGIDIRFAKPK